MTETTPAIPLPNASLAPDMQAVLDELLARIAQARMPGDPPRQQTETAEEWVARLRAWVNSQPSRNPNFDDSRESIYD